MPRPVYTPDQLRARLAAALAKAAGISNLRRGLRKHDGQLPADGYGGHRSKPRRVAVKTKIKLAMRALWAARAVVRAEKALAKAMSTA
jgi:hypothetical protein